MTQWSEDLHVFFCFVVGYCYLMLTLDRDIFIKKYDKLFSFSYQFIINLIIIMGKPFVVLHPNSVYALDPDLLRLNDRSASTKEKGIESCKHCLLAYLLLLETTKPYLVNCLKVPALHTLLLFANSIDTNSDLTRLVFDKWIEVRLSPNSFPENFLSTSIQVRDLWLNLLTKVFQESLDQEANDEDTNDGFAGKEFSPEILQMKHRLNKIIDQFLSTEIPFTIKRLVAADVTNLYKKCEQESKDESGEKVDETKSIKIKKETKNIEPKVEIKSEKIDKLLDSNAIISDKGGIKVNHYLTYNCLSDNDISKDFYIKKTWQCLNCNKEMVTTLLDEIRHKEKCFSSNIASSSGMIQQQDDCSSSGTSISTKSSKDPLAKKYSCELCQQTLYLSSIDIVKHIRSHKVN